MIYQALYELAEREQLITEPAFEPKEVAYLIKLGIGGTYLGYSAPRNEPVVDRKGKPKGTPRPPKMSIPRRSDRTVQDQAEFLVDKAEYVFGVDPKGERASEKLATRKKLFFDYMDRANRDIRSDALRAVLAFLQSPIPPDIQSLIRPEKESEKSLRAGELFAFVYEPENPLDGVHNLPAPKQWFADELSNSGTDLTGQCLVTGMPDAHLTRLHAKPKNIPPRAKTKGGVPLTSVNAEAFKSYLLDNIQCAPISMEANIAVETALNRLLDDAYVKPDGTRCEKRNILLSPDTVLLFWSREAAQLDWFRGIETESPEKVAELLRSPYRERSAPLNDPAVFYAMILSGSQGRAILRSFVRSTVADVARAVEQYRQDVRIVRPYGEAEGSFGLLDYRRALVPRRELDLLPHALATDLYLAIIFNRPFPQSVLETIVRRNRAEVLPKREKSESRDDRLLAVRCSLLKAWLSRNRKEKITVGLDRQRMEPSYRLGRLLAVIDRLQQDALGNVNATLVDRYYGSASSTPGAVFPTLLRRSQHHLGKLRREKPGFAVNTEKLLQEVVHNLPFFPKTMTLEEQGLFALGFYHQRQDFFTKKEEPK